MKKLIAMLVIAASTATVKADISIEWIAGFGFYNWNTVGAPVDPTDYINDAGGVATAYLIYSDDAVIDLDLGNLGGQLVDGVSDSVLDSFSVTSVYGDYSNGSELYAGALQGGYVFLRIIDTSAPGGASGQYYDSSMLLTTAYDPLNPSAQQLLHNSGNTLGDQMQVVPEPSVLAFLGIGAALVGIRRMRRS